MDKVAIDTLQQAGINTSLTGTMPVVPIRVDDEDRLIVVGEEVPVLAGDHAALVKLKSVTALFTGDRKPPDFSRGPTAGYELFFAMLEKMVVDYGEITGRIEKDLELERLYRQLRRRPEGWDPNPLFGYLQATARLYMSIRNVSQAEFEAVVGRLARSAGRYVDGPTSTNYYRLVSAHLA